MRFNIFVQKNGTAYGSLVCTVCNKSVSYDLEHPELSAYGEGAKVISMLASPRPPKDERKRIDEDAASKDLTL